MILGLCSGYSCMRFRSGLFFFFLVAGFLLDLFLLYSMVVHFLYSVPYVKLKGTANRVSTILIHKIANWSL